MTYLELSGSDVVSYTTRISEWIHPCTPTKTKAHFDLNITTTFKSLSTQEPLRKRSRVPLVIFPLQIILNLNDKMETT